MINQNETLLGNEINRDGSLSERSENHVVEQINPAGIIAEIVLIVVALIFFNSYPERISFITSNDQPMVFLSLFAAEIQAYLPLLNLWWGLGLALSFYKFQYRRWSPGMRLADFALSILGILVLYTFLIGEPILNLDAYLGILRGLSDLNPSNVESMSIFVHGVVKLTLVVALVGTAFSAVGKLIQMMTESDVVIPADNV